jgi:hypothetical protein
MIKIDDSIISHFDEMTRDDFRTLLIISRYMTEGTCIPFEKLKHFWSNDTNATITSINSMVDKLGWRFWVDGKTGEWFIEDTFLKRVLKVEFCDSSFESGSAVSTTNKLTVLPPKGGNTIDVSIGGTEGWESKGESLLGPHALVEVLEAMISSKKSTSLSSMTNIVNHFLAKKKAIDPLLVIDKRERGKNFGNAKYLTNKYLSIDEQTWLKAIDFFFNDPFWSQHFTSLIFLDKHLQKFLVNKPRRASTKYKVVS